jgi:Domain of unknown function (DUF1735)/Domain of unknown function (DUF4361)
MTAVYGGINNLLSPNNMKIMKKKLSNISVWTFCLMSIGAILISSCVYDESDKLVGKGPNILRVDAGPDKLVVAPSVTSTVTLAEVWRDANAPGEMDGSVSVSFGTNNQIVTDYNTEHDTEYVPLNAALFSFDPAQLTFESGVFKKSLVITLKAAGLDLTKDYAIGLTANVTGWVAGGDKFIKLALPSAYAGDYISTGVRYNFTTTADADFTNWPPSGFVSTGPWTFNPTTASTLSSKTVAVHAANSDGGFGRINITVNANNSVTIVPNDDIGLNALVQSTHRPSTYNPTTKTFELYYEYTNANGTFRMLRHQLVKK